MRIEGQEHIAFCLLPGRSQPDVDGLQERRTRGRRCRGRVLEARAGTRCSHAGSVLNLKLYSVEIKVNHNVRFTQIQKDSKQNLKPCSFKLFKRRKA